MPELSHIDPASAALLVMDCQVNTLTKFMTAAQSADVITCVPDLLAMAREGLRNKLRAAIQQASRERAHATATGAQASYGGSAVAVRIEVHPVQSEGEELLLVSFFDEPEREQHADDRHEQDRRHGGMHARQLVQEV